MFTWPDRVRMCVIMGLAALLAILETASVGLIPLFVLALQSPEALSGHHMAGPVVVALGVATPERLVVATGALLLATYVLKTLFGVGVIWLQNRFAESRHLAFSSRLLAAYLYSPYVFHMQSNSSSMVRSVLGETGIMFSCFLIPAFSIVAEALTAMLIVGMLLAVQPLIALVTAGFFGISSFVFYRTIRRRIADYGATNQRHGRLALQWLTQSLAGVKEVKLLGKEKYFIDTYASHAHASNRAANNHALITQLPRYFNELVAVVGMLIATAVLLSRNGDVVVPTLAMFAVAATRIIPSLNRMVTAFSTARYGLPALESVIGDVTRLERTSARPLVDSGGAMPGLRFSELVLRDIAFSFGDGKFKLEVPHLEMRRGSKVGFVGPSGSGKTTLVDLITGLHSAARGDVMVNGERISAIGPAWQRSVGYIPQSIYLLDDTIRRNVAFGIVDRLIDDLAVRRAIEAAQLGEFVDSLGAGLDTEVGDRGVRLSGGQRQRIGIARALYYDPEVLVLDEGTSALDTVTETQIVDAINSLGADKTVIVVAHRLSTVKECDTIYLVKEGRIAASGTYDALSAHSRDFQDLLNPAGRSK